MILGLVPIYESSRQFTAAAGSMYSLKPAPDLIVFCENNSTDDSLRLVSEFKAKKEILRLWFREDAAGLVGGYGMIAIVRQFLLQRARELNPDYAVFLDADIVIRSTDLIQRLISRSDFDIVGGAYTSAYPAYLNLDAARLSALGVPAGLSILDLGKGPCLEVDGVGGGCMCLRREVLQDRRLNFYPIPERLTRSKREGVRYEVTLSEDLSYCLRAKQLGYRVGLDTTVSLSHLGSFEFAPRAWRRGESSALSLAGGR